MINETELKFDLMNKGINVTPEAKEFLISIFGEKFYRDDYITTSGIMMEFGHETFVVAKMSEESPYCLTFKNGALLVSKEDDSFSEDLISVKLWEPNPFMMEDGHDRFGPAISSQFSRVRISPIRGCSFHCAFCSLNEIPYGKNSVEELTFALQEALKDERVTEVLISGGSPKIEDLPYLTEVYEHFCKTFPNVKIDVMMAPRGFTSYTDDTQYLDYIKHLRQIGVDTLAINIELFDDELSKKYCAEKYNIGRDRYLKFLKLAREVFGPDNVRSAVIVGLESKESTLEAVEKICECGCLPVLSPYMPYNGIGTAPTTKESLEVREKAEKIAKKHGVSIGPIKRSNTFNTL